MTIDAGSAAAIATIGTAVVTYLLAPIIKKLMSRDERTTNIEIMKETAAVKALRSALDGLQEENARLREVAIKLESKVDTLNIRVASLETQLRTRST